MRSVAACMAPNGTWINCTIILNQSNPLSGLQQTDTTNFPAIGFIIYAVAIIGAFGFFRIVNYPPLLALSYTAFVGVLVSIILVASGWATHSIVDVSISLTGGAIFLLWFFR